ncbi:MAG: DUF362 domain-containing protein [Acidobacteriota bacterium]
MGSPNRESGVVRAGGAFSVHASVEEVKHTLHREQETLHAQTTAAGRSGRRAGDDRGPAHGVPRRAFFQACGAVLASVACGSGSDQPRPVIDRSTKPTPRVVVARDPNAVDTDLMPRPAALKALLESGVRKVTGAPDMVSAFRELFKSDDRVGIKVNCLAGRRLSSHTGLVVLLTDALRAAGIRDRQILIWDRSDSDLQRAGFDLNRSGDGPFCFGTNADYEAEPTTVGSVAGCFSRILTEYCTALISVPVLKDHDLAGVSGTLKNFYGAIHNPNKYHDSNCDPYIADLNTHPAIQGKLRLVVCDALVGQCHGGPAFNAPYAWPFGGLLVSTDPVAVDRIAWKTIEERRREKGLPSLADAKRAPTWIASAERLGLGTSEMSRIEEVLV